MNCFGEARKFDRHRFRSQIEVSWNAGKAVDSVIGNCMDVSLYGMLIESPAEIAVGTKVQARVEGSIVPGEAIVRHCRRYGPWFRIGLKFREALPVEEMLWESKTAK